MTRPSKPKKVSFAEMISGYPYSVLVHRYQRNGQIFEIRYVDVYIKTLFLY